MADAVRKSFRRWLAGSALARCVAKDDAPKYFAIIDILFKQQNDLASDALGTINRVGKQAGFSEQMIKDCVQGDPKIQKGILDVREHAYSKLKVNSTPFFFVNGTAVKGETSFDAFEKLIKPLLKSWLDENLPRIVEAKVEEEVHRIARGRGV